MLVDDVTVSIKAGNGGNGAVSFRRNAQTAKGGPDGGNGGNGGNIYFEGTSDATLLQQFQYKKSLHAEDGIKGMYNNLYGRNGEDLIVKVPVGTRVTDVDTGWKTDIDSAKKVLIARGGWGGKGNNEFKSATNQAPRFAEKGTEGEARKIRLELRLIADVGFIGLPNAGKSSLLKALTNANPKIGDYPFTTLEPNLGVLDGVILADIPGLIEGASKGKGLGIKFLKHIEKTRLLMHCIDVTTDDILRAYNTVRDEFSAYNESLLKKTEVILLTKVDLVTEKELMRKKQLLRSLKNKILVCSIHDEKLLKDLRKVLLENR